MPPQPFNAQYQNAMQAKAENNGQWNATQGNKADLELCNNLMLLNTVALTATVIVLGNDKAVASLNKGGAILLIISSICVVASIFFGIANYIVWNRFQRKWARINGELAGIFSAQPLTPAQIQQVAISKQANIPLESQRYFWYAQIGFLVVALLLYLAIIIIFLAGKL